MHYFTFASKDSYISSGSNRTTGVSEKDRNFGQDQILEVKKEFFNDSFDYPTRALVQFDLTTISESVADETITNPSYYLRLYEADGNQEQTLDYTLLAQPISQSWDEGVGKSGDNPKTINGCSWENRINKPNISALKWSGSKDGSTFPHALGGATHSLSSSTQIFSNQSPDVEMDITAMTNGWISGSTAGGFENYGLLLRFSGSEETDSTTFGQLKFFSKQTHTIFSPKLEVRWDDHLPATGSNTGSLSPLNVAGTEDNYLYVKQLKEKYKETDKVKFRVGARKRYIQKTFSTSVQEVSQSFVPEGSGSYAIRDVATGENIVPFSDFTKLSCDVSGSYFTQWLNTFEPNRVYKIMLKLKTDDKNEQIFDEDFEFKVKR